MHHCKHSAKVFRVCFDSRNAGQRRNRRDDFEYNSAGRHIGVGRPSAQHAPEVVGGTRRGVVPVFRQDISV